MQWWNAVNPLAWFTLAFGVLFVLVLLVQSRRSKELAVRLEMLAREMGWSELAKSSFFTMSVQGIWNGYSVRIRRVPRQKGAPERILCTFRVQAPARIIITRRQRGIFGRPLALFGPPVIELPLHPQFWIRSDEITLAERLMKSSAAPLIDRALHARFDVLRMRGEELTVIRVSATDPDGFARIAREELELLRAVVEALALRP
ncbi:MAG TPA: hypothetical protein VGJ81_20225 [Thermoanaerobaculia bacterium]|jgi:hypothetical protein